MAKTTGLGAAVSVDGYALTNDVGSGTIAGGLAGTQDVTGIDKSAYERIGLGRTGSINLGVFYNPSATKAHDVLSPLTTGDRIVTFHAAQTIGSPAACLVAKQVNYDWTRGQDGALTIAAETQGNGYGLEWGDHLTAYRRTDSAATNGASVDGAASSTFGLQAYLHVYSFSGTDVTIKIQESSDDGAGDAFADVVGGGFTAVTTAPTKQRIATAAGLTVERYLRVVTTTTGGFTQLVFTVVVVRNKTATVF